MNLLRKFTVKIEKHVIKRSQAILWHLVISQIVVCATITSCRQSACSENQTSETLNVRLGWLVNANSAGQIAALEEGYYAEQGLNVVFHEGGMAMPSVKTVAAGVDQIGFANGPELVIAARAAGVPLRIVAVIHQEGYHAFFVHSSSSIKEPKDWKGKRVGIKFASPTFSQYQALLLGAEISRNDVTEVPLGTDLMPFLAEEIDVYPGAKTNEGLELANQGVPFRIIEPESFGVPTMGNVIFTTEAYLQEHESTVRRFIAATMKGWEWCKTEGNRQAAVEHLSKHNAMIDKEKELSALGLTLKLLGDGEVPEQKLQRILDAQLRFGQIAIGLQLDDLIGDF